MEKNLYKPTDTPTRAERQAMWEQVRAQAEFPAPVYHGMLIHWRSFAVGFAASVLFMLAGFGAFSLYTNLSTAAERHSLDSAYSEAMNRLLDAAPETSRLASDAGRLKVESRLRGIEDLDAMIEEIRNDMLLNGSNDIKKKQLRSLYAMKMDMVKELVLDGEITL